MTYGYLCDKCKQFFATDHFGNFSYGDKETDDKGTYYHFCEPCTKLVEESLKA